MTQIPCPDEPVLEMPGDVLRIENEMTIYQAEALKAQLITAVRPDEALALDLGGVTEIDSSGIQLLMLVSREAGRLGAKVCLAAASDPVQRLLEAFALQDMIAPVGEPADAEAVDETETTEAAAEETAPEVAEKLETAESEEANHG